MSRQRSPLKPRNINFYETSMRKQLGKKQLKRKSSLFGLPDIEEPSRKRMPGMYDESLDGSFGDSCSIGNNSLGSQSKTCTSPVKKYVTILPIDLRLATKIRIISAQPFPFSNSSNNNSSSHVCFKSPAVDESCRLLAQTNFGDFQLPSLKSFCPSTILKSAGLYYQYPDIGFMQMFPRLDGVARTKGIRTSLTSFGNEVVDSIQFEWLKSFDHLYNSWKDGKRNAFYVCGPQFTILFIKVFKSTDIDPELEDETCMGYTDFWEHRVIITPTSCGFRKLLKQNDVSFILPLKCGEEIEREDWLRNIGFSPSKLRVSTTDSQETVAAEDSGSGTITTTAAESTIAIVNLHAIDAFCKIMIDSNLGWAKTGQQAGLPPTILAAEPFMNSALKSLSFTTQVTQKEGGTQYALNVEDGPILPHVPLLLHEFFRSCNNQLKNNVLKVYVNGRSICDGFNEAASEVYKSLNEFTFDGRQLRYFY